MKLEKIKNKKSLIEQISEFGSKKETIEESTQLTEKN